MHNYIFDGEIHALSKEWAYIIKRIDDLIDDNETLKIRELHHDFCKKYSEYLSNFDKDEISYRHPKGLKPSNGLEGNEYVQFRYQPPWKVESLYQHATFAIKFKRVKNDNLDEFDEK